MYLFWRCWRNTGSKPVSWGSGICFSTLPTLSLIFLSTHCSALFDSFPFIPSPDTLIVTVCITGSEFAQLESCISTPEASSAPPMFDCSLSGKRNTDDWLFPSFSNSLLSLLCFCVSVCVWTGYKSQLELDGKISTDQKSCHRHEVENCSSAAFHNIKCYWQEVTNQR